MSYKSKYNPDTGYVDSINWYPNGQMKKFISEGYPSSSQGKVSVIKTWYENGQQKMEDMNINHRFSGWYKEWDEDGKLIIDEIWANGHIDREKTSKEMMRQEYRNNPRY